VERENMTGSPAARRTASAPSRPTRRRQAIEATAFIVVIIPAIYLSLIALRSANAAFPTVALVVTLRDVAVIALILFLLRRNHERPSRIGWRAPQPYREVGIGLVLFVPMYYGLGYLTGFLREEGLGAHSQTTFLTAMGATQYAMATIMVAVAAITEETAFRGYLILRLRAVLKNTPAAVLLSSAVFSLGHTYEGLAGVIGAGVFGAAASLIYLWRRSLVAPVVMHFLQDFLALVAIPVLTRH
jgi:uncharacterized protein